VIAVRPVENAREYVQACDLAEAQYQRYGYCHHLEDRHGAVPTVVALDGSTMVGSVQFRAAGDRQLPIEYHFGIEADRALSLPRAHIYEVSRLTSARRSDLLVVTSLLVAVLGHAYERGFTVGLGIVKPALRRVLNDRVGIPMHALGNPPVLRDRAGVFAPYLLQPPAPILVSTKRDDARVFLPRLQARLAGRAAIDVGGWDLTG
jgi:hypothetical protein